MTNFISLIIIFTTLLSSKCVLSLNIQAGNLYACTSSRTQCLVVTSFSVPDDKAEEDCNKTVPVFYKVKMSNGSIVDTNGWLNEHSILITEDEKDKLAQDCRRTKL